MIELLTAAQMRAIEEAAIGGGDVTGLELMERAGQGVVDAILEEWPELDQQGADRARSPGYLEKAEGPLAVVVCGPGNNGGDGFVIARLLKEIGWWVEVFLYGDAEKLPPDARVNYERWSAIGAVQSVWELASDRFESQVLKYKKNNPQDMPVVIDALFGAGLNRPLEKGLVSKTTSWLIGPHARHVAVDGPSGLCLDSGKVIGETAVRASLTVTFQCAKLGHYLAEGPEYCGRLKTVEIGASGTSPDTDNWAHFPPELVDIDAPLGASHPIPAYFLDKQSSGNKFCNGHALVLSGPATQTGAARLAARGALRTGAGLVTIGGSADALGEHAAQVTAIMLSKIDGAAALADKLKDDRITSLCLGPGMGVTQTSRELVEIALKTERSAVLDADALTLFQDDPGQLFAQIHKGVVLTPHGGEFARLFPDIAEKLNVQPTRGPAYSKVDATREAAARAGCVVLLKGPDTVIANQCGQCSVNSAHYERAAPWLATAGSGDVLAGFVTGLMARGRQPMLAAEVAAWLHVQCALRFGPGLIAEDLPEQIPAVFRDLGI